MNDFASPLDIVSQVTSQCPLMANSGLFWGPCVCLNFLILKTPPKPKKSKEKRGNPQGDKPFNPSGKGRSAKDSGGQLLGGRLPLIT